jgi:Tfp pilus assembly protein PilF
VVLGNVALSHRKPEEAIGHFQKSLELDSKLASAHVGVAYAHQLKGRRDQAIQAYRKVIEMNPDDARSYNNLAWLLAEEKGSQEEALVVAQRAHQLRPNDGRIMDTVGWVYYKQGKLAEAEQQFRAAADLLPKEAAIQYHLGLVAHRQGRAMEASTALKRALLLNPEFEDATAARKLVKELGG